VTGLPVSRPWKIGLRRWVMAGNAADRLQRGRRVVPGVFRRAGFHHGLAHVDFELDHDLGGGRHFEIAGLATHEFPPARPRKAAGDLPVVGRVGRLHLAGIGQHRIDADDQRRARRDAELLALRQMLAETVVGLRRERGTCPCRG